MTDIGSVLLYSQYLTPFQIEKFTYLFNCLFDLEKNSLIESNDMEALAEKMRVYSGWSKDSAHFQNTLHVMKVFFECLIDQAQLEKSASAQDDVIPTWEEALKHKEEPIKAITLNQWLNMWGKLCYGSAGINDFPCWVQMLPHIFFKVIDYDKDDYISINEYRRFYKDFVGIPEKDLDKISQEGFRAMTAGGDYILNQENFDFCFANFLLGRAIYGPGKYVFGVFDNRDIDETFQVIYNSDDEE